MEPGSRPGLRIAIHVNGVVVVVVLCLAAVLLKLLL